MNLELIHYSPEPVDWDLGRTYTPEDPHGYQKPVGLWVSVKGEDDWPSWCVENEFREHALAHAYRVILRPDAAIRRISTPEGIDSFHAAYAREDDMGRHFAATDHFPTEFLRRQWPIDWAEVATIYQGIIIAPYQWERRMGPMWYYGFDCASGCIWDCKAIACVEEVRVGQETQKPRG